VLTPDGAVADVFSAGAGHRPIPAGQSCHDDQALDVPIWLRGRVYAVVHLHPRPRAQFNEEDQQLLGSFAATAGVAVSNATLYLETQQQRQWLASSNRLTQDLLAGGDEPPLSLVLHHAMEGAGADMAAIAVPEGHDRARLAAAAGILAEHDGELMSLHDTVAGRVLSTETPVLVAQGTTDRPVPRLTVAGVTFAAAVGVPLISGDGALIGALTVARAAGGRPFTESDRDHLAGFAGYAGVALELDRARQQEELVRNAETRDRIAHALHDKVIQDLFAIGMGLQGLVGTAATDHERQRLTQSVQALDDTIASIRRTVFEMEEAPPDQDPRTATS